jgi:hypothetical protein
MASVPFRANGAMLLSSGGPESVSARRLSDAMGRDTTAVMSLWRVLQLLGLLCNRPDSRRVGRHSGWSRFRHFRIRQTDGIGKHPHIS